MSRWMRRAGSLALAMGLVWLALPAGPARAQITATLTNPITITKHQDLSFGAFFPANVSGTVTITLVGGDSERDFSNVSLIGTAFSHAEFTVTGDGPSFNITLPASTSLSGPGTSMTVNTFTSNPASPVSFGFLGERTIRIGAILHVGANQAGGTYTGTFSVTVSYP